MRDPKRIDTILEVVRKIWNDVPDQRFLQLVYNIVREAKMYTDTFYLEDDKFLEIAQRFMRRNEVDAKVDEIEKFQESTLLVKENNKKRKKK